MDRKIGKVGAILGVALVLRLAGLTWGLPASDGWDDDGVAPRDFLVGTLQTYSWGQHYTYPPLHLLILTIESAPVWLLALLRAPSLGPDALVPAFIQVPTMTALAVIARATAIAMSLATLWNVAKLGQELRGTPRAGAWTAAACAASAVFTYYSQTSNLDVPYLFWGVLALRALVGAIARGEPAALRRAFVLAALAVCTKDQAYALFLFAVPAALVAWPVVDPRARRLMPAIAKNAALGLALAVATLLVVDGAIVNPPGFAGRVRFLLGTASQDHTMYASTWTGRLHILRDTALGFGLFYPWVFAPLAVLGLVAAWRTDDGAKRAAGLVPLLVAASFTLAFNLTARRTEVRFLLPQMLMAGIYIGLGCDALQTALGRRTWAMGVLAAPAFAWALYACVSVDAAMVLDPRYDAERWMRDHIAAGDRVEVYDNNVHLPRLPEGAVVERIDVTPPAKRNPLPGVTEIDDAFSNVEGRQPRFIVVSDFWALKYLLDAGEIARMGRALSPQQALGQQDLDSRAYFRELWSGAGRYRLAHVSAASDAWPRIDIHESLDRAIRIYERVP